MDRTGIRVEPFSTYLERRRKGPINPVIVAGGFVFVSGLPPFDPHALRALLRSLRIGLRSAKMAPPGEAE